jgi:hypothetical protein
LGEVYFATLSVVNYIAPNVRISMNKKLKRIWNEVVVA